MKKLKKTNIYIFSFIIILVILIALIVKELWKLNENYAKTQINIKKELRIKNFKNELLEDVMNRLKTVGYEHGLKLEDISLVKYDNKTYLKISIQDLESSNYLIHYESMNVTTLHANIWKVTENNIEKVSKAIISLIMTSDKNIQEVEAIQIYSELLTSLNKNKETAQLKFKNGLVYSIEASENEGIVFMVK